MATDPTNRESNMIVLLILFRPFLVLFMSLREGRPGWSLGTLFRFLKRLITWLTLMSAVLAMVAPQPSGDRDWQQTVSTQKYGHHALTPRKGLVMVADTSSRAGIYGSADPRDQVIYLGSGRFSISSTDTSGPGRVVIGDMWVAVVSGDLIADLRDKDHPLLTQISGSTQLRPLPGSGYAALCEQLRNACGERAVILSQNQQIQTDEHPRNIAQVLTLTSTNQSEDLTAWRRGSMSFSGVPLTAIGREFEQYYDVEFDIDPALRSRVTTIGGQFSTDPVISEPSGEVLDSVAALRRALEIVCPDLRVTLHSDPGGHRTIRIRKRSEHAGFNPPAPAAGPQPPAAPADCSPARAGRDAAAQSQPPDSTRVRWYASPCP